MKNSWVFNGVCRAGCWKRQLEQFQRLGEYEPASFLFSFCTFHASRTLRHALLENSQTANVRIQMQNRGDSFISLGRRSLASCGRSLATRLRKSCVGHHFRIHHVWPVLTRHMLVLHCDLLDSVASNDNAGEPSKPSCATKNLV